MPEGKQCPHCGATLPVGALAGLCPACLLQQGATADSATQPEATLSVPPGIAEVARLFPQLEVFALIGKGGMGAVYKARQPALDRLVALKLLPSKGAGSAGFAERFNREARALARLSHPNIVALHEFGQVDGHHFFIMEYVDGVNLRQLQQAGRLSPREALQIVPQICDALQYAHDEGIVHRDIKPENVLVDRKGRVKIADFGLAKILGREPGTMRLTGEGQVMGTPHYMAPEQVERPLEVDHRADIFALGVVFYEMLTGELPLGKFAPPSRKVQVDVRLDEVVLHVLEKEPDRRYQQASQVKEAVETITATTSSQPGKVSPPPQDEQSSETKALPTRLKIASAILFVLGLANLLGLLFLPGSHSVGNPPHTMTIGFYSFLVEQGIVTCPPLPPFLASLLIKFHHLSPLVGVLALVSAWKLRQWRGFALATTSVVFCFFQPLTWALSIPLGITVLILLWRRDIRERFAAVKKRQPSRGGALTTSQQAYYLALASAAPVPLILFCLPFMTAEVREAVSPRGMWVGILSILTLLAFWCQLGGVILGALALAAMRRCKDDIRGLGWAVFGVAFNPIVIGCGLLTRYGRSAETTVEPSLDRVMPVYLAAIVIAALLAWWCQRHHAQLLSKGIDPAARTFLNRVYWTALIVAVITCTRTFFFTTEIHSGIAPTDTTLAFGQRHRHRAVESGNGSGVLVAHAPAGIVELSAISEAAAPGTTCWFPDGTARCPSDVNPPKPARASTGPRELMFYLGDSTNRVQLDNLHFECLVQSGDGEKACTEGTVSTTFKGIVVRVPADATVARLRVGLPVETWEMTDASWAWTGNVNALKKKSIQHDNQDWDVVISNVREDPNGLQVSDLHPMKRDWEARLVAVDQAGNVHEPDNPIAYGISYSPLLMNARVPGYTTFRPLRLHEAKRFVFQVRPYRWVEFRNISLVPGQKTQVEVMDAASATPESGNHLKADVRYRLVQ